MLERVRVPAVVAPEAGFRMGRVRISDHSGHEDVRTVTLGDGPNAWALWAHQTRFALDNTQFIDLGDAVYRSATIDRIEPLNEDGAER